MWSVPTSLNWVWPCGVTDQPVGAVSVRAARDTVVRPLLVNDSVTVAGVPGVTVPRPLAPNVTFGPTLEPGRPVDTRYITTPCAGTAAVMAPAVSVLVWDQRSRSW